MRRAAVLVAALLLVAGAAELARAAWIPAKAVLAQWLLERAWHEAQAARQGPQRSGPARVRPWPWADTWPVARLRIPRLGVSQIVLAGASGSTLAFGPGHTPGTALPGTPGTAIVSGHRDTHFAALEALRRGDAIEIERPGAPSEPGGPQARSVRYRVAALRVVDARTARIHAAADEDALVLVTCWPFDAITPGGPLRLVVTAYAAEARAGSGGAHA